MDNRRYWKELKIFRPFIYALVGGSLVFLLVGLLQGGDVLIETLVAELVPLAILSLIGLFIWFGGRRKKDQQKFADDHGLSESRRIH